MIITEVGAENLKYFKGAFTEEDVKSADLMLGAIYEDASAGGLAVSEDGDDYLILSLYVAEDYRRKGIGRALIDELQRYAAGNGMRAIRSVYELNGNTEEYKLFLENLGFTEIEEYGSLRRFGISDVDTSKLDNDHELRSGRIVSLSEITDVEWDNFALKIMDKRDKRGSDSKEHKTSPNVYPLLKNRSSYDTGVSFMYLNDDDETETALLASLTDTGYSLSYLWNGGKNVYPPFMLIGRFVDNVKDLDPEAEITVLPTNPVALRIVDHLVSEENISKKSVIMQYRIV